MKTITTEKSTSHIGRPPGILLHAGAVKTDKGALLFLGHSKAGKSTICNLLATRYELIADDMVHVQYRGGKGWVANNINSYMEAREQYASSKNKTNGVPIHAIMRIYQSDSVNAQQITQKELCFQLTNSILEGIGQSCSYSGFSALHYFRVVAEMARDLSGWSLHFTKKNETLSYISSWLPK